MLIVFSGLPGVGKTTIARELARASGAIHLRIDSIEHALRQGGRQVNGDGYRIAHAIAADNLRLGRTVVADCVNPWPRTRDEWQGVAERIGVRCLNVEIVCSDRSDHRRRVDARVPDIEGHVLPTWAEVRARDYQAWTADRLVIDTSRRSVENAVTAILAALDAGGRLSSSPPAG